MSSSVSPTAPMPVTILETRMIQKGALIASLKISLGKMVLHDISLLFSNGKSWPNPPSKPQNGRDGVIVKDPSNHKTRYVPVVEWADRESRDRFSAGVITAFETQNGPISALAAGGAR